MKQRLKRAGKWLSEHADIIGCALWVAIGLTSWNALLPICLLIAMHHFIHYNDMMRLRCQRDLIDTMFKQHASQLECIEVLANRLVPFIGSEQVGEILAKYQVEWDKNWKDFNDKHPPKKPKKKKEEADPIGLKVMDPVGSMA